MKTLGYSLITCLCLTGIYQAENFAEIVACGMILPIGIAGVLKEYFSDTGKES